MKTLFASIIAFAVASAASAQVVPAIQESGDIFADIVRLNSPSANGLTTLSSPFNMGFVSHNNLNSPILPVVFTSYNWGTANSTAYDADYYYSSEYSYNVSTESAIGIAFGYGTKLNGGVNLPGYGVTMYATDVYPCIETKLPKGTYTFQATATPNGSTSTPGNFVFATQTEGNWTTQFSLALPKAEGATRTLTFAHDTRVRWMLINQSGQTASATITAKYYNSGN